MSKRTDPPAEMHSVTSKHKTGCGSLYVVIASDNEHNPRTVLISLGKSGGCAAATLGTLGRVISVALQHDVPMNDLIKQCTGVGCYQSPNVGTMKSCVAAVGHALENAKKSKAEWDKAQQPTEPQETPQ